MLIAETLLLLLTDEDSGKPRAESTALTYACAGALLLELSLSGRVDVAGPGEAVKAGRLVVRNPEPTGDAPLDKALVELGRRQNKKPRDVIGRLAKGIRDELYESLAARGVVRREEVTMLGVIPRRRWPVVDTAARWRAREGVEGLVRGNPPDDDPGSAALVSLLAAIDKLPQVAAPDVVGLSKKEIRRRGKEISADSWAPKAVKDAVASVNAAIYAAVVASVAATAATAGSS